MSQFVSNVQRFDFVKFALGLCKPAQIGLFLSMLTLLNVLLNRTSDSVLQRINDLVFSAVGSLLYVMLLNLMCQANLGVMSWVVVAFPYVTILINRLMRWNASRKALTSTSV